MQCEFRWRPMQKGTQSFSADIFAQSPTLVGCPNGFLQHFCFRKRVWDGLTWHSLTGRQEYSVICMIAKQCSEEIQLGDINLLNAKCLVISTCESMWKRNTRKVCATQCLLCDRFIDWSSNFFRKNIQDISKDAHIWINSVHKLHEYKKHVAFWFWTYHAQCNGHCHVSETRQLKHGHESPMTLLQYLSTSAAYRKCISSGANPAKRAALSNEASAQPVPENSVHTLAPCQSHGVRFDNRKYWLSLWAYRSAHWKMRGFPAIRACTMSCMAGNSMSVAGLDAGSSAPTSEMSCNSEVKPWNTETETTANAEVKKLW